MATPHNGIIKGNTVYNTILSLKLSYLHVLAHFIMWYQGRREGGGYPGLLPRGPDTNCYKFTSTARYEVKLIAD